MITLQKLIDGEWTDIGEFHYEHVAWMSLNGNESGYRTIHRESGKILTDKSGAIK